MIQWPTKFKVLIAKPFEQFVQLQANRLALGQLRYRDQSRNFLTLLDQERRAYHRTGNKEHLLNIANYAFLESVKPSHATPHFSNRVPSATRE